METVYLVILSLFYTPEFLIKVLAKRSSPALGCAFNMWQSIFFSLPKLDGLWPSSGRRRMCFSISLLVAIQPYVQRAYMERSKIMWDNTQVLDKLQSWFNLPSSVDFQTLTFYKQYCNNQSHMYLILNMCKSLSNVHT